MKKTDARLRRDVLAELAWEPSVDATFIGIDARAGVISWSGRVATYTEKWRARHAIERVAGVAALVGELAVELGEENVRVDADIARSAQNVIEWITYLPVGSVYVEVENGWVTLAGQLAWPFQKQGAEQCIASLMGVTGISNEIRLAVEASAITISAHLDAPPERRVHTTHAGFAPRSEALM
ncbi:BON domain-containing protein [Variovorax sp. H27-G14]|uniref:BON domain-containing protein n=1 Tax=Variovorax sp. H27-G14 TaxID=3111914 RepID=UPI0038FC9CCD